MLNIHTFLSHRHFVSTLRHGGGKGIPTHGSMNREEGPHLHPPLPQVRPATGGWPGDTQVQGREEGPRPPLPQVRPATVRRRRGDTQVQGRRGVPIRSRQAGQAFLARGIPAVCLYICVKSFTKFGSDVQASVSVVVDLETL